MEIKIEILYVEKQLILQIDSFLEVIYKSLYIACLFICSAIYHRDKRLYILSNKNKVMKDIQTNEIEWYLRDHFFRKYNQGLQHLKKEDIAGEMIGLYLRYKNYNLQDMNNMITIVVKDLISRRVIKKNNNNLLELTSRFSRLQCSKCFYISYLNSNEPRNCLRCSSTDLHDFPKKFG